MLSLIYTWQPWYFCETICILNCLFQFSESIINVISYCRQRNENYLEHFLKSGSIYGAQLFLLPICFHPRGWVLKLWASVRAVFGLTAALLVLFQLINVQEVAMLDNFLFITDLVAYVDIYIMMLVGYYGAENQLIFHPSKTVRHYLRGKFIVDLTTCLPLEISGYTWFKLNRMGQMYKMIQLLNYFSKTARYVRLFSN